MELSHHVLVSGLDTFPSGGFFIKVSLGSISVRSSGVSEVFLVSDIGIDNFKFGIVGIKSSVSFGDGLVGDFEEVFEGTDLFDIDSVSFQSGVVEVLFEFDEEVHNLLGGGFVGEVLSDHDEGLGKMGHWGETLESGGQFFEVVLSFFDFNKRTTAHETGNEGLAFTDGFNSLVVFNAKLFIESLCFSSLSGGFSNSGFSIGNELFINSDKVFEDSSLWVESVLEMSSGNTESNLGVSESEVDFFIKFVMFSSSPSIFFLFTGQFKVKVFDKVLEGGNEFSQWSSSLELKF